jgi:hypothetical protein
MKSKTKVFVILDGHGITKKQEFYSLDEIKHDYYFFNDLGKGIGFATLSNNLYDLVAQNYTFQFKEFEHYEFNNQETKLNKHYLKKLNIDQFLSSDAIITYGIPYNNKVIFTPESTFPMNQTLNLRQLIERSKTKEEYGLKEVSALVQINNGSIWIPGSLPAIGIICYNSCFNGN